jgi:hypothetical protein
MGIRDVAGHVTGTVTGPVTGPLMVMSCFLCFCLLNRL